MLQPATATYVDQLEKRLEEKDGTITFLQDELIDRRAQIGGMKAIIDGQRQLLETINNNVAPVFGALAQLVRGKSPDSEGIRATIVNDEESREATPPVAYLLSTVHKCSAGKQPRYNPLMDHIGGNLQKIEQNIKVNSSDPVALHGFTQLPNFILKNPDLSIGAKTTYALFLSYAWHNNLCFPGQERLAKDIGMSVGSINTFVKELESAGLIEIARRGQGKTNLYTVNFLVKRKAPKS